MEINVTKIFLLVIDKDQKRRKETPVPDLEINGERLQTMNFDGDQWRKQIFRIFGPESIN